MLRHIATFELRYQLRSPLFFIAFVMFFMLAFGASTVDGIQIGDRGNVHLNSPYAILQTLGVMYLFAIFVVTAFVAGVVVRDDETGFAGILHATRITKFDYLVGRFSGAVAVAFLVMASVPLGILIGSQMPWIDPEKLGPTHLRDYLYAAVVYGVPTLLLISAALFALATATRSMMWSYLGAVGGLILFVVSRLLLRDPAWDQVAALSDPFGLATLRVVCKYWTAEDRNTLLPAMQGVWLYNRLLWVAVALILFAIALWRFDVRSVSVKAGELRHTPISAPPIARRLALPHGGVMAGFRQCVALTRFDLSYVFRSPAFLVLLALAVFNSTAAMYASVDVRGVTYLPVTRAMVTALLGAFTLFPLIVAIYYGGDLVWRDRDRRMFEIIDATVAPGWAFLLPKVLAIVFVVLATLIVGVLTALLFQWTHGYRHVEIDAYALWFLLPTLILIVQNAALSVFVQVLVPAKPAGWAIMLLYIVANVALATAGYEHKLYNFGETVEVPLSDMNGLGRFWIGRSWHQVYWSCFVLMLLVTAHLMWPRGSDLRFVPRLRRALRDMRGPAGALLAASTLAWATCGAWVWYNTDVLNPYTPRPAREQRAADYEKQVVLPFENLPEPTIRHVKLEVALFPKEARATTHGSYVIENRTASPIDTVHIQWGEGLREMHIDFPGARVSLDLPELRHQAFTLAVPMQPGERRTLRFDSVMMEPGFVNNAPQTRVVPNGTFLDNFTIAPFLGAPRHEILRERSKRNKFGLKPELRPAKLEDAAARAHHYLRHDSDWVTADIVLTTDADQTPVAPGSRVSDTTRGDRRTLVTHTEAPIQNFFSLQSARYAIRHDRWTAADGTPVELAVYFNPAHASNVQRMLDTMKVSLDEFSRDFSPFQFHQARILEFPAYADFAQSFAGTIPYSEGIGFIQDYRPGQEADKIDLVTMVTAHEMAHQWWAHQLIGADQQGMTMLSETFAQYSALLVMERLYGKAQIRKFLKFELDGYLRSRGGEVVEELPLARVENQGYIHYEKGALVMYRLKEEIGETAVNRALAALLRQFAFNDAPYPTSTDFLRLLRTEAGPAHAALIADLFERITLYDLKASDAHVTPRSDGRWDATFTVEAHKRYAEGRGRETEMPLSESFEIGAFTAEPARPGYSARDVVRVERRVLRSGRQQVVMQLDRPPKFVGIDPFNMCIDRNSDDNLVAVTR